MLKFSISIKDEFKKPTVVHIIILFIISFIIGYFLLNSLSKIMPSDNLPVGVDVYPLWNGTQAFLDGESPYTKSVQTSSQQFIYGREALPSEDPFPYYYPIYTSVIFAPITLFRADQAAIIWPSIMLSLYITIFITASFSFPIRLPPIPWGGFILSILLFRPAMLTILNGQYGILIIACWISAWVLNRYNFYFFSGVFLAISLFKPSLSVIPVGIVILWALISNRKKIVYGFTTSFFIISCLSFLGIGWWLPQFLEQIGGFTNKPTSWQILNIFTIPGFLWLITSGIIILIGIKEYVKNKEFPYIIFLGGIFINLIITPHTSDYDLIMLIVPILYIATFLIRSVSGYIILIVLISFPWLSWLAFLAARLSYEKWQDSIWLYYPLIILVSLIYYFYKNKQRILNSNKN